MTIGNGITTLPSGVFYTGKKLMSLTIGSGVQSISQFAFQPSDPWSSEYNPIKTIWMTNTPPEGYSYAEGTVNYVSNDLYSDLDNETVYRFLSSIFEVDGVKYVPVSPSERTCEAIDCTYDESVEIINIGETVSFDGVGMTVKGVQHYTCYNNIYVTNADLSFEGYLGGHAFQNCTTMTTVMLGNKILSIGSYAFEGCKALTSIVIPNAVTSLGGYAFQNCSSMTSVKMGTGVTKINPYTFSNCSSLTDMQIGSKVETIDVYAFSGCSALPTIMIPQSVTDINDYTFSGCTSLMNVNMEERNSDKMILTLGSNDNHPLFADCPLDEVYIGRNISYSTESDKGYSPFYRNTSLRKVTITDRETEISMNEFYGCTNLQDVTIGDGVENFGDWAFSGCSSLKHFSFGMNVETIGREAFSDCTSMESIFSRSPEPPVCGSQALDDINKWTCILTVPAGNKEAYQAADQWKEFFYIEEGEAVKKYFDIDIVVNEGGKVLVNNKEEIKVSLKKGSEVVLQFIPNKGYSLKQVIVNGEDVTNQVVDGRYTLMEMPAHDVTITISFEKSFIPGDANGDGLVNVTDIVAAVNYIMDNPSDNFNKDAADLNGDGIVNVTDIVQMVNIIMNGNGASSRRAAATSSNLIISGNNIQLRNADTYTAVQFDINLSDGQSISNIVLNGSSNHSLSWKMIDEKTCRVVVYSMANAPFLVNSDNLFTVFMTGGQDATISNEILIKAENTTGIDIIRKEAENGNVYDLNGRQVKMPRKGLYIINGRKVIVK